MANEIYLVKTNVKPDFFSLEAVLNDQGERVINFLRRLAEQVPEVSLPLLLITSTGYITPWAGPVDTANKDPLPQTAKGIYNLIADCIEGRGAGHLPKGEQFKVRTVVDFTQFLFDKGPRLLQAYGDLRRNYEVREVLLKN